MDYDCGFTKENKWFRYRAAVWRGWNATKSHSIF